jgi:hypothetical protein
VLGQQQVGFQAQRMRIQFLADQLMQPCWRCRDNLRGFFEHCFPYLLKRVFGYDDKEASWLHIVASVRALVHLFL